MHVLVVDDDPGFLAFTASALDAAGVTHYAADSSTAALDVLAREARGSFDVILLDVMLPDVSGWDLLLKIRESGDETPIIFVTGKDQVQERVKGLRLGADDYLVKPVEYDELVARLEVVLRRRQNLAPIEYGDLRVNLTNRRVDKNGRRVELSPREYDLLLVLVRGAGEVLSRSELLSQVWDIEFDPGTNVLEVHVGRLRKKLESAGKSAIETVRGQGYRIVPV